MSDEKTATVDDQILNLLGFNPSAENPTENCLTTALQEIEKERTESLKSKAKEMIVRLMDLKKAQDKVDREYKATRAKFEKTAGKLLKNIESFAKGQEPQEEIEETSGQ